MSSLRVECPFCHRKYLFGARCDCLDTSKKIGKLHKEVMDMLSVKNKENEED